MVEEVERDTGFVDLHCLVIYSRRSASCRGLLRISSVRATLLHTHSSNIKHFYLSVVLLLFTRTLLYVEVVTSADLIAKKASTRYIG
jgi:hypothetical protein